jgi:hypothetical protein
VARRFSVSAAASPVRVWLALAGSGQATHWCVCGTDGEYRSGVWVILACAVREVRPGNRDTNGNRRDGGGGCAAHYWGVMSAVCACAALAYRCLVYGKCGVEGRRSR